MILIFQSIDRYSCLSPRVLELRGRFLSGVWMPASPARAHTSIPHGQVGRTDVRGQSDSRTAFIAAHHLIAEAEPPMGRLPIVEWLLCDGDSGTPSDLTAETSGLGQSLFGPPIDEWDSERINNALTVTGEQIGQHQLQPGRQGRVILHAAHSPAPSARFSPLAQSKVSSSAAASSSVDLTQPGSASSEAWRSK